MNRSEKNNPTTRIGNLLDDFDALEAAYDETVARITDWTMAGLVGTADFEALPAKPVAVAIAEEKVRRQLTLGKVGYKRNYMRRARARGGEASVVRELTPEEEAGIMAELGTAPSHEGT